MPDRQRSAWREGPAQGQRSRQRRRKAGPRRAALAPVLQPQVDDLRGLSMEADSAPAASARASMMDLPRKVLATILSMLDEGSRRNFALAFDDLKDPKAATLDRLPSEILTHIASFLSMRDLGSLAGVNRRLRDVADSDWVWAKEAQRCLVTNGRSAQLLERTAPCPIWSSKERVRISRNWTAGRYVEMKLAVQGIRYMPRIHLERSTLWASWGNRIWCHPRRKDGTVCQTTRKVFKSHTDDVSKFVVKDGFLISGGRDRTLVGWHSESGEFMFAKRYCHGSEVSAVDVVGASGIVVTGSRDRTVKLWSLYGGGSSSSSSSDDDRTPAAACLPQLLRTTQLRDRIWSLAAEGARMVVGTAGLVGVPSLHLVDLETGHCVEMGRSLMRGAGMLEVQWLPSSSRFLSCGYDSCTRLWDARSPSACVAKWEEPFNEAIYCFDTDGDRSLVCGTARHGLVRLWDMRRTDAPVRMYHAKHPFAGQSSPVYSVAFDQRHLYVALDQCINLLSFSRSRR